MFRVNNQVFLNPLLLNLFLEILSSFTLACEWRYKMAFNSGSLKSSSSEYDFLKVCTRNFLVLTLCMCMLVYLPWCMVPFSLSPSQPFIVTSSFPLVFFHLHQIFIFVPSPLSSFAFSFYFFLLSIFPHLPQL